MTLKYEAVDIGTDGYLIEFRSDDLDADESALDGSMEKVFFNQSRGVECTVDGAVFEDMGAIFCRVTCELKGTDDVGCLLNQLSPPELADEMILEIESPVELRLG